MKLDIKITACAIVKNEERNIGAWLACMAQFADEIVVVDTGSTDATQEIVRRFTTKRAQLYTFPWTGDFAAAKNFALDQAHGNWIAFLDADETFSPASIPHIRPLLARLHPDVRTIGVMCRLVNVDPTAHGRFIGASAQLRLFRHLSSLRYTGRVHEALNVPKHRAVELVKDIEIIHTGYAASIVRSKLERNLALLKKKIAAQGGETTVRDDRYLMDCYYGLDEHAKAIVCADRALARGAETEKEKEAIPHIHMIRVSSYLFGKRPVEDVLAAMDAAIAACPEDADFPMMKGLYLYEQGDALGSEEWIERALTVHAGYQMDVAGVVDNFERFVPSSWWVRGEIAHQRGDEDAARAAWLETLRAYRYHAQALRRLVTSLRMGGAPAADIIELLNGLYDVPKQVPRDAGKTDAGDAPFLAQVLLHCGGPVLVYYAARAHLTSAETYFSAGRYDAAQATAADELDWTYKCGIADAVAHGENMADSPLRLLLSTPYREAWSELADGKVEGKLAKAIARMNGGNTPSQLR